MLKLATLEEVSTTNSVSYESGIRIFSDIVNFGGGIKGEALIGINHKHPSMFVRNLMNSPSAVKAFIAAVGNFLILPGALNKSSTKRERYILGIITTKGIVDYDII
jgi:hypothetical protein